MITKKKIKKPTVFLNEETALSYIKISDVQAKPINWLWKNRIARGKITIFAGAPGLGKSQMLLYFASLISNGGSFPIDKAEFSQGNIAILSTEDELSDTIKPRLLALKANMDKIFYFQGTKQYDSTGQEFFGSISLDNDLVKLDKALEEIGDISLIIIDPISAYLGDINDYNNAEVRNLISRLTSLAQKHNAAIILNTHLSKPKNNVAAVDAINRINGSIAYVAAARAAYLICKDPEDPKRRLFLPIKNNIGDDETGFAYQIKKVEVEGIETSHIEWLDGAINLTANEALEGNKEERKPEKHAATEFLIETLKEGCKSVSEIMQGAEERNISIPTLYRAKIDLKINEERSIHDGRKKIWMLPPENSEK